MYCIGSCSKRCSPTAAPDPRADYRCRGEVVKGERRSLGGMSAAAAARPLTPPRSRAAVVGSDLVVHADRPGLDPHGSRSRRAPLGNPGWHAKMAQAPLNHRTASDQRNRSHAPTPPTRRRFRRAPLSVTGRIRTCPAGSPPRYGIPYAAPPSVAHHRTIEQGSRVLAVPAFHRSAYLYYNTDAIKLPRSGITFHHNVGESPHPFQSPKTQSEREPA